MAKQESIGYRHYFAALRIFGKIPDFDRLTKELNVSPDHIHCKGEHRTPTSQPYRHDSWQLKAPVPQNRSLEHHLRWLYRRLVKKTHYMQQLAREHDVDLYCSYHSNYDRGNLEFPPEVLKWCGELRIPLRVSILIQE